MAKVELGYHIAGRSVDENFSGTSIKVDGKTIFQADYYTISDDPESILNIVVENLLKALDIEYEDKEYRIRTQEQMEEFDENQMGYSSRY